MDAYKRYTIQARTGIRGEAFFELLVCNHCLPHHIVGSKDVGIDYICEWVYGDKPTGVLFAVQVKTFSKNKKYTPQYKGVEQGRNELCRYEIHNTNLRVSKKTLHYWKGLGMPVYLFAIIQKSDNNEGEIPDCYYKRFTEIMTNEKMNGKYEYHSQFYRVNQGSSFIAFKNTGNLDG